MFRVLTKESAGWISITGHRYPKIKLKEPLDFKVSMLPTQKNAWIIIYKKILQSITILSTVPVLVKESGVVNQQVKISQVQFRNPCRITFTSGGKEMLSSQTKIGFNQFFVTVPMVKSDKQLIINAKYDNGTSEQLSITLTPVKKWEMYLVQHAHTDIGYTRPQSQIDRFKKRIGQGRIEVTGMYFNMAEIADENIMFDFFQPLKEIKDQGITVKTTMQNDVNGVAWCLPDYLKNTGVRYLTMGINETRSILPFKIPTCFWWEAPSGSRLLAYRSDHYMTGNNFGLPVTNSFNPDKIFEYLKNLEDNAYPFDRVAAQFSGYFTDNSPPSTGACEIIKAWNEKYESPKLRLATASEFLEYVEKNYSASLPVYRNAWLDWWTDGFGSTSRETAKVRKTQNLKQVDEGLFAMVSMLGGDLSADLKSKIEQISENALFFDEHTVGADESIDHPYSENSTEQWLQKGAYAWEALKKVTLLNEEGLARIQEFLKKADFPVIYVINSMGWTRSGDVNLFVDYEVLPVNTKARIIDLATGKEVPAQVMTKRAEGAYWVIEVSDVPAMGVKALKIELLDQKATAVTGVNTEVLENKFYKIIINKKTGAVSSLFDKELNQELADGQNPYNIGQPVKETSKERDVPPFTRTSASNVKIDKGINGAIWESVRITMDLEGFEKGTEGSPQGIELEIRLFKNVKKVEFRYMARKLIITDPEALYVAFPFSLPDSRIVFETIGGTLTQGQQLPGSSSDWNAAQNFVSVRGKKGQIVVVSNEVPLWHFSDFNMGKWERYPKPGKTWLYSWVMNNYWMTNFRAFQEGGFSWGYQITSSADTTNTFATKYAWSERNPFPTRAFPAGANELKSPTMETLKISGPANAMLVNSRPVFNKKGTILLHFRELEGLSAEVKLSSSVPGQLIKRMVEVNTIGKQIGQPLSTILLKPYEVRFIEVEF